MAKCDKCQWADQCLTYENDCDDYTPVDECEDLDKRIEEGLYEFREEWWVYTHENYE